MSSPVKPVAETRLRGGNTDCALTAMSELASRIRITPAMPMDALDRVAVTVGASVAVPEDTVDVASAAVVPLPVATAASARSVTVPNVTPAAAMASAEYASALDATPYPISAKSPAFQVSAVVPVAEKPVPLVWSSPKDAAHRQPVPAVFDRLTMRPAMSDPDEPDGIAVVGFASPPSRTRAKNVSRRGPADAPKDPPPPDALPTRVQPDGVDGTESRGCPDTTWRTARFPADPTTAGVTVSVWVDWVPVVPKEIVNCSSVRPWPCGLVHPQTP
jgi:hypothetical protein